MKKDMIIRAWKDPEFRAGLSPEERTAVPECPAGVSLSDLDESSLAEVVGGNPNPDDPGPLDPRLSPYVRVADFARLNVNIFRLYEVQAFAVAAHALK